MMIQSTITDKGQTTVPKEVREVLGVKPRERIQWDLQEDGTVSVRAEPSALALFGSLKPKKKFPGLKEEKAAVRRRVGAKAAREDREPKP